MIVEHHGKQIKFFEKQSPLLANGLAFVYTLLYE